MSPEEMDVLNYALKILKSMLLECDQIVIASENSRDVIIRHRFNRLKRKKTYFLEMKENEK